MTLALLRLQAGVDPRGVTILAAREAELLVGDAVPAPLADQLRAAFAAAGDATAAFEALASLLPSHARRSGPSYVIPPGITSPVTAHIERDHTRLVDANPGNWHPVEWRELLAGDLGPVAIATVDDRVASICHTPGPLGPQSAEAGVWTHRDVRGRGLASATTAAWAALVAAPSRHLFYSTEHDNLSSQRVAARLGLSLLGWTYRLQPYSTASPLHPLCSLSR